MKRFDSIAQGLLKPINPYSTLVLGVMTFIWGFWIANPWWTVFDQSQLYSQTAAFAPEWAWGSWSLICGATIILAVFSGMTRLLSRALGFATWHWFTFAGFFWWGDWQNTGGIAYTFVAIYALYAYINIKMNLVKRHKKQF